MPIIRVSIAEGKTHEELRALIGALHKAAEDHVGATPDGTIVLIEEHPPAHWSRANVTIAERRAK
jgi:4-oxalocrotonate tautomerase